MNKEELLSLSHTIFMIMCNQAKESGQKPKLLNSIAFSEYNKNLNLNLHSADAILLTALINQNITNTFYGNVIEYETPKTEYANDNHEYEVTKVGNRYIIEEHSKTK